MQSKMNSRHKLVFPPQRQRDLPMLRFGLAVVAAVLVVYAGPIRSAFACWYDPIIFDPQALLEHGLQLLQLQNQVAESLQQLELQARELQHVNVAAMPSATLELQGLAHQLQVNLYSDSAPQVQLATRYPPDMSAVSYNDLINDRTRWVLDQRQSLAELRQLQNQIVRDHTRLNIQVGELMTASDSAPGETAALQIHNDLLGAASNELSRLQMLRLSQSRRKTESIAKQESELSYASSESQRVRAAPAPPTSSIVSLFSN